MITPARFTLIDVHHINGEKVLDRETFCQHGSDKYKISLLNSTVVFPERCFVSKGGFGYIIQAELWNIQRNCISEMSGISLMNGFAIPFTGEGEIDRFWRSRSPDDCKHFCFATKEIMEPCNGQSSYQFTFVCAFCLRNKFGEQGDKYMGSVCGYNGPMTLDDKLQLENDKIKTEEETNYPGIDDNRPSFITQLRFSHSELLIALMTRSLLELPKNT